MEKIIGRTDEQEKLAAILKSKEAELMAVYGRRRVGKTFLINNYFEKQLIFDISGIDNASMDEQLENFTRSLSGRLGFKLEQPGSWLSAFEMLKNYLAPLLKKQKRAIFFDEFPWLQTPRSGFLGAFDNFWNTWASKEKNLIVILCGSAAAWMIEHVVNNTGGLHRRVTRKMRLLPFTLSETTAFLQHRSINLDRYQLLQIYMAMGGIPEYLKGIARGQSAMQAIDTICFSKDGFIFDEFKILFQSLFDEAKNHIKVIRALAKKGKGLTRTEIINDCGLSSGGWITRTLEDLTESGFITSYIPFDRTVKDNIYRLTDEYCAFYLKFIEGSSIKGTGAWARFSAGSSWKSWAGFAFENICLKHEVSIKKALGIENVNTTASMWRHKGEKGAQIDMLIDRADHCINVCEMKFSTSPYDITKGYATELQNKLDVFRDTTGTRKTLFGTMVTTYGVKNIDKYPGLVQSEVTMEALFK